MADPSDERLNDALHDPALALRLDALASFEAESERFQDVLASLSVMDWPDLGTALAEIARVTAEALRVARVSIWRYDKARSAITCALLWQDGTIGIDPLVITEASAPNYWQALHRARTLAVEDAVRDPATQDFLADYVLPLGIGALMDTGIRVQRETLGIVCVEHVGGPRPWTAAERVFLGAIGERAGIAMIVDERRALEANALAAQRFEAAGLLAAGVAHDFNNLTTAMLASADLAAEALAAGEDVGEDLAAIRGAAQRAAALSRKLLAVGRQDEFNRELLDLGAHARAFLPIAESVAGRQVALVTAIDDHLLPVRADRDFVDRLLLNLVTNAVQAMPDGGRLGIATDIVVRDGGASALPPGRYARLSVSDTGVGIDRATLARIFEPFFTTKGRGGNGLGLSMVFGGMRQHDGHVLVESEPGRGSTFHACFPLHEA